MAVVIIGVLSVALYPQATAYIMRGRDTTRVAHVQEIAGGLAAYYSDRGVYPLPVLPDGCIDNTVLGVAQMPK